MNAVELKEYIIKNDKIEYILEDLGCHKLRVLNDEIRCALPNHNNPTSVRVKTNSLSIKTFDDEFTMQGDLFTFIMKIKDISFSDSVKYVHNILGLKYSFNLKEEKKEEKKNILSVFLNAKNTCQKKIVKKEKLKVFPMDESEFIPLPHISWVREGITPAACRRFNIGYDNKSKRIIIPHRLWCGESNDYVGIIGRTTIPNYELLDIPKYCSMRKEKYPKTMNVYGLQENYESIQDKGYVVVYEAEKSVLKRYSVHDKTGVAICGHEISDEQEKILISLNVDIIIAMDKGIDLFHVRSLCEKFYKIRKVYYMYDFYDVVIKGKDSPADLENKLYDYMFKYKKLYDEEEHHEYMKELRNRRK